MTFEEWMKRPVYVAQCHTWALANKLGLGCPWFRCLPGYRDDEARQARRLVAEAVRFKRARRRGLVNQDGFGTTAFFWVFTGPGGVFGGTIQAQDVRHALVSVLVAVAGDGELFAKQHMIPQEIINELPGNRQPLFALSGPWGRLTSVVAAEA